MTQEQNKDTLIEGKIKELKELLKCGDKNCQEGHYPAGYDAENDEVEWGGCPNCVVGDKYLPRVDPYELKSFFKSSLQEQREMIEKEWEDKTWTILEDYTNFLLKNNYCDNDVWGEEPKAVDRFLEQLLK